MKRRLYPLCLVVASLVCLGSGQHGQAQQSGSDLVPFKASVSGPFDAFLIPSDPPVLSVRMTLKGTSDLQSGEITYTDTHVVHLGVDGVALKATNGMGVLAWASGDALFVYWDGAGDPSAPAGTIHATSGFTIKGGRGKFAGVTGSGVMRGVINVATGQETQAFQGLITRPKP